MDLESQKKSLMNKITFVHNTKYTLEKRSMDMGVSQKKIKIKKKGSAIRASKSSGSRTNKERKSGCSNCRRSK
tara:strand:+ start:605 stop:823 length:219 start_codon:yes stop_codon:yes gene_type:complete